MSLVIIYTTLVNYLVKEKLAEIMDDGVKANTGDVKPSDCPNYTNHSESQACNAYEDAIGSRIVNQHPGLNSVGDLAASQRQEEAGQQHGMAHAGRLTTAL